MESLTNIYNETHDTGDDGIEDAQKDDQLDKEKSDDEESFIGEESGEEESGEEESDNEENERDPLAENEEKKSKTSTKLTPKVMASAVYTFMLLDFQKRWNLPIRFDKTMSKTIINNLPTLKECFEKTYSKHTCSKPGCSHPNKTLIGDGNLKSTRRVCGAETAGIDKFETTGATVMTGCKNIPITGRRFCKQHENKTPHISHKKLSKETLAILRDPKFTVKEEGKSAGIYTIEGIHDKKVEKVKEKSKKGKKKKIRTLPYQHRKVLST